MKEVIKMKTDLKHLMCVQGMLNSLDESLIDAGGSLLTLDNLSAQELVDLLAPNGIRFVFKEVAHIEKSPTQYYSISAFEKALDLLKKREALAEKSYQESK
jgi:hypothetical protein